MGEELLIGLASIILLAVGFIDPDAILGELLLPVVSISVAVILFEGGLSLRIAELGEIRGVVRNLVTLMGIVLANQKTVEVKHIIEFKENMRVLLTSFLFIIIASRVQLSDLSDVGANGLLFLGVLIFIARPAVVGIATFRSELSLKEKAFLSSARTLCAE